MMMSDHTDNKKKQLPEPIEGETAAFHAALSVHYIVLVLYAIGTIGGSILVLISILTRYTDDSSQELAIFSIPPILFSLHLLAVIGLKKAKPWGYNTSKALGYLLLLIFPFGTVLGVILLMQLSKFRFAYE